MKIGIITFTYGQNFGNKLQNYALLRVLQTRYGKQVFTLQNFDTTTKGTVITRVKRRIKLLLGLKGERVKQKKQKIFNNFNKENLNYYPITLTKENYERLQDFDVLVCGSDQIWNPWYSKDIDMFTGKFAKESKRISYAASIGLDELPEKYVEAWTNAWMSMYGIGVREESAINLIEKYTKRKSVLQIDPTMLLGRKEWSKFEKKPCKRIPTKYIVTYFICEMNSEAQEKVNELAKKRDCEVIHLNNIYRKEWYDISPNEFVYLIHHAE
ncbi:polysaccharide pyruvyl transferase family protein, partial [Eubacterium sp.]